MTTLENLKACRAAIAALEKIAKDCDPASGVSFSVRRGVARDDEENPRDAERRPWVTAEISDVGGKQAIAVIIASLRESEAYRLKALQREIQEASAYLKP